MCELSINQFQIYVCYQAERTQLLCATVNIPSINCLIIKKKEEFHATRFTYGYINICVIFCLNDDIHFDHFHFSMFSFYSLLTD